MIKERATAVYDKIKWELDESRTVLSGNFISPLGHKHLIDIHMQVATFVVYFKRDGIETGKSADSMEQITAIIRHYISNILDFEALGK